MGFLNTIKINLIVGLNRPLQSSLSRSFFSIIGVAFCMVGVLGSNILIARIYTVDEYGAFVVGYAIIMMAGAMASGGFPDLIIRRWSEGKSQESVACILSLQLIITLILTTIAAFFIFVINSNYKETLALIMLVPTISMIETILARLRINAKYIKVMFALIVPSIPLIVASSSSFCFKMTFQGFCSTVGYSSLLLTIILVFCMRLNISILIGGFLSNKRWVLTTIWESSPYASIRAIGVIRGQLDIVLVRLALGTSLAGAYVPATILPKRLPRLIKAGVDLGLLPRILRFSNTSASDYYRLSIATQSIALLGGVVAAVISTYFAQEFLGLFGENLKQYTGLFIIMAWSMPIKLVYWAIAPSLKGRKTAPRLVKAQVVAAAVFLSGIFPAAKIYGLTGVVCLSFLSDLLLLILLARIFYSTIIHKTNFIPNCESLKSNNNPKPHD